MPDVTRAPVKVSGRPFGSTDGAWRSAGPGWVVTAMGEMLSRLHLRPYVV